jgi:hypothetical protein
MFRLDKNVISKGSFKEADDHRAYWLSKTPMERLQAAIYLQSIVFNFDPLSPPKMDKSYYTKRKRES